MAVFANGGTSSLATTDSASTAPATSANGRRSVFRRDTASRTSACTSPTGRSVTTARPVGRRSTEVPSVDEIDEVARESRADVGPIEGELDVRVEEVQLLADVVPTVLEHPAVDALGLEQQADRVGELELAAGARLDAAERFEDLGGEHVPAHDREVRRRVLRLRLLDDGVHLDETLVEGARADAAVRRDPIGRKLLEGDHRSAVALVHVEHRAEQLRVVHHDVVTEQLRERFVTHVVARHRHRVAEPVRITLADEVDVPQLGRLLDLLQQLVLTLAFQVELELEGAVEVVFNRAFAATGDHEDVSEPRPHGLLDDVLDRGFVDDRQHLLRQALRGREETGAEPRSGNDGLPHLLGPAHGYSEPLLIRRAT